MTWIYLWIHLLIIFIFVLYNDFKRKNYEHESYVYLLFLLLFAYNIILFHDNIYEFSNILFYLLIVLILILLIIIKLIPKFLKTQVYRYKMHDENNKSLYTNDIEKIIKSYTDKCENEQSQIILDEEKIIFKNIDRVIMLECLSSIDNIIETRRKSTYKLKDYIFIYLKKLILPVLIFSILLYLIRIGPMSI